MFVSTSKLLGKPFKSIGQCRPLAQAPAQLEAPDLRGISSSSRPAAASADQKAESKSAPVLPSAAAYFDKFQNHCHMIEDAKSLARRSVLVDHCGSDYIDFSSEFTNVECVYAIEKETPGGENKKRLTLIEFASELDAEQVSQRARHNLGVLPVPLKILRYQSQTTCQSYSKQALPFPVHEARLWCSRELDTRFKSYTQLVANNTMSQVDFKMRFITLVNFERVLCAGLFQEYELMPFGSSVIDIGRDYGDLDILLTRKKNHYEFISDFLSSHSINNTLKKGFAAQPEHALGKHQVNKSAQSPTSSSSSSSKLVHIDRSLYSDARDASGIKATMRWFDYMLKEYMPLTEGYNVIFLRNAKVPIIKFTSLVTSLDCDLSFDFALDHRQQDVLETNYSAIIMSQLLYSICRNNNLFSAVIVYLKIFAKLSSITGNGVNVGWTNFQFLSLILFYLQNVSIKRVPTTGKQSLPNQKPIYTLENSRTSRLSPIVPPFKHLLNSKHMSKYPTTMYKFSDSQLNKLIPEAVVGFFEFYSKHDFLSLGLNLFEARTEKKLDNRPVYVTNPFDRTRNICHNVNREGLNNLTQQVCKAASLVMNGSEDPLSLIRSMMVKYKRNVQWNSAIPDPRAFDYKNIGRLITQEVAQDVFR